MIRRLARLRHALAHWLGWDRGTAALWWDGDRLLAGSRCACGRVRRATDTGLRLPPAALLRAAPGPGETRAGRN